MYTVTGDEISKFWRNANYITGFINILWISLLVLLIRTIYKMNNDEHPSKNYYYIGPIVVLLSIVVGNIYYIYYVNSKNRPAEKLEKGKVVYFNVSLVPLYLAIVVGMILAAIHSKNEKLNTPQQNVIDDMEHSPLQIIEHGIY